MEIYQIVILSIFLSLVLAEILFTILLQNDMLDLETFYKYLFGEEDEREGEGDECT